MSRAGTSAAPASPYLDIRPGLCRSQPCTAPIRTGDQEVRVNLLA